MSVYALTPLAKADIFDIWSYIAGDNQDAADRVDQAKDSHGHALLLARDSTQSSDAA
jgi:plasmid stabilization system protein ParE